MYIYYLFETHQLNKKNIGKYVYLNKRKKKFKTLNFYNDNDYYYYYYYYYYSKDL